MPARAADLNLLPKEPWEKGALGQFLTWVLSVGRYVVIFTELIVISAFLYRFGLDRILTDLRASIKDKQTMVTDFGDLESSFRLVQKKLTTIKAVSDQPVVLNALDTLSRITPTDAVFISTTINNKTVVIAGTVASQAGLATLLNQAQSQAEFSDVILENVKSSKDQSDNIEFRLTLTLNQT